jgi:7tm Chemosensory receptor
MILESEDWKERERLAQLERMITQMDRFSAMRFFTVDRAALLGVLGTVATYLIIVLQTKYGE